MASENRDRRETMKTFGNKLDEILADKQLEVEKLLPLSDKLQFSAQAREEFRSFETALGGALREQDGDEGYGKSPLSVIAEVKKGSPSAGIIEVQIYEAVVAGADAILLIVGALEQEELVHLLDVAHSYQLDVLVEVHDLEEMERALETDAKIIGVNNRNLKTIEVALHTPETLSEEVGPYQILVSESGIYTGADTEINQSWRADAILVGEALMRSKNRPAKMAELKGLPVA